MTIFREVPLNIKLEDLKPSEMKLSDNVAFHQILEELEFRTLLKRLTASPKTSPAKHLPKPSSPTDSEQENPSALEPMKVETDIIGENSWQDWLSSVSITQEKPLAMVADATFTNQHDVQWIGIALSATG